MGSHLVPNSAYTVQTKGTRLFFIAVFYYINTILTFNTYMVAVFYSISIHFCNYLVYFFYLSQTHSVTFFLVHASHHISVSMMVNTLPTCFW